MNIHSLERKQITWDPFNFHESHRIQETRNKDATDTQRALLKKIVLQVKKTVLYRTFAWLNGSLHHERVLQTDGEYAVDGSIYSLIWKSFHMANKRVLLLLQPCVWLNIIGSDIAFKSFRNSSCIQFVIPDTHLHSKLDAKCYDLISIVITTTTSKTTTI